MKAAPFRYERPRRLAEALPAGELVVLPGGHGLVLERPAELADAIAP